MSAIPAFDADPCRDAAFAEQLEAMLDDLAPLFVRDPAQPEAGRRLARQAVMSYQPACDADLLSIGQIVMASKTSMALLREVAVLDMMPNERMQLIAKAQTLSRTATQVEATMERRRKRQAAALATAAADAPMRQSAPEPPAPAAQPPATVAGPHQAPPQHPYIEAMRQFANVIMTSEAAIGTADIVAPPGIDPDALKAGDPWALLEAARVIGDAVGTIGAAPPPAAAA